MAASSSSRRGGCGVIRWRFASASLSIRSVRALMKLPQRFSLSALLLATLFVALACGYAQWRRQRLKAEVAALVSECDPMMFSLGSRPIQFEDHWFWPTVSDRAAIVIREEP